MKTFIASTLSSSQNYTNYSSNGMSESVVIHGGHSLVGHNLVTIEGVVTQVSDNELKTLNSNVLFNLHVKNGFVKITNQGDPAKAVSDLESRDQASPLTQQDVDKLQADNKTNVDVDFDSPVKPKTRGKK